MEFRQRKDILSSVWSFTWLVDALRRVLHLRAGGDVLPAEYEEAASAIPIAERLLPRQHSPTILREMDRAAL
jgi:hypothetical protein